MPQVGRRRFDGGEQVEVVLEFGERRHEDVQQRSCRCRSFRFDLRPGRARGSRTSTHSAVRRIHDADSPRDGWRAMLLRMRDADAVARCRARCSAACAGRADCAGRAVAPGVALPASPPPYCMRNSAAERNGAGGANGSCAMLVRIVALAHPRQRIERQPVAHRRIAGDQVHAVVAEEPRAAHPASARCIGRSRSRVSGST